MGIYYCHRCDNYGESKDGASVEDPTNELEMIHEDCLTEEEILELEREEYETEQAIHEDVAEGRREDRKLGL